jgi:lysyl-tRNA synthetase, class II
MDITEELVSGLVKHLTGGYITKFYTRHGEEFEVIWQASWRRVIMIPALEETCGVQFPSGPELHTKESNEFFRSVLRKMNVERSPAMTDARILDKLVGEFIEETCVNPTFITGHPQTSQIPP